MTEYFKSALLEHLLCIWCLAAVLGVVVIIVSFSKDKKTLKWKFKITWSLLVAFVVVIGLTGYQTIMIAKDISEESYLCVEAELYLLRAKNRAEGVVCTDEGNFGVYVMFTLHPHSPTAPSSPPVKPEHGTVYYSEHSKLLLYFEPDE